MTNPIEGTVAVIANYGVGKTTFALGCGYQPKDMVFINDDVKSVPFVSQFKKYVDLVASTEGMKILELHEHCLQLIDKLPKTKVIIWDTWTRFQTTFPAYVKANPNDFRNPKEYSAMGKIKAAEQYNDAYQYEGQILAKLRSKCDLLIITFHVKQHYENNVAIPNKLAPGHDRAITKYSDMRLWLIANPDSSVPSGVVLKNIAKYEITKEGIEPVQVLPQKLYEANWKSIGQYYENPIADRTPEENETPDSFELSLIEGTLTAEEKRLYEASIPLAQIEDETESAIGTLMELQEMAKENKSKPLPVILKLVKEQADELGYEGDINMGLVAKWVKS